MYETGHRSVPGWLGSPQNHLEFGISTGFKPLVQSLLVLNTGILGRVTKDKSNSTLVWFSGGVFHTTARSYACDRQGDEIYG